MRLQGTKISLTPPDCGRPSVRPMILKPAVRRQHRAGQLLGLAAWLAFAGVLSWRFHPPINDLGVTAARRVEIQFTSWLDTSSMCATLRAGDDFVLLHRSLVAVVGRDPGEAILDVEGHEATICGEDGDGFRVRAERLRRLAVDAGIDVFNRLPGTDEFLAACANAIPDPAASSTGASKTTAFMTCLPWARAV